MYVMQSDIEGISEWVILQLQDRGISLVESARKVMIAKAIGAWREHGLRMMREMMVWEISLLPAIKRPSDRVIDVCSGSDLRNEAALRAYFLGIGCRLRLDSQGYYVEIPKTYDASDVRQRIRKLLRS